MPSFAFCIPHLGYRCGIAHLARQQLNIYASRHSTSVLPVMFFPFASQRLHFGGSQQLHAPNTLAKVYRRTRSAMQSLSVVHSPSSQLQKSSCSWRGDAKQRHRSDTVRQHGNLSFQPHNVLHCSSFPHYKDTETGFVCNWMRCLQSWSRER